VGSVVVEKRRRGKREKVQETYTSMGVRWNRVKVKATRSRVQQLLWRKLG
jgi:hypothetical protein